MGGPTLFKWYLRHEPPNLPVCWTLGVRWESGCCPEPSLWVSGRPRSGLEQFPGRPPSPLLSSLWMGSGHLGYFRAIDGGNPSKAWGIWAPPAAAPGPSRLQLPWSSALCGYHPSCWPSHWLPAFAAFTEARAFSPLIPPLPLASVLSSSCAKIFSSTELSSWVSSVHLCTLCL